MELWTLGKEINQGLAERGHPLLDTDPIELLNASAAGNSVLEMRQGGSDEDLTGSGFTGPVLWVGRYVTNAGVEEVWAAANNNGTAALARRVSSVWSPVSFSDTVNASNLRFMQGVGMNGKFFLFYDSDVNRLHVWDGTSVRRVGLITATAPTVLEDGAGALSFTRYYRQRNTVQVSGVTTMRSEPSSAVSVTIASKTGATVTKGAVSGDGETHWEVEASAAADGPWYRIATVVVGTTTYDDTGASISTADPSDELGLYVPPPSAKYGSTDGLSMIMGGAWEVTPATGQTFPKANRTWFTPPLGASDVSDDERIPDTSTVKNWLDVGDAGPITALQGPVYGETYVAKKSMVGKLTPTGNVDAPYALSIITTALGCVDQRLMTTGEVSGIPAILFADSNAVYALTASGGISCLSEPIGMDLRGLTIVNDPGLLLYDPLQRTIFLQTSHSPPSTAGKYRNFTFDTFKRRWSGFSLGGAVGGWILGVSRLGIDTVLGGTGTEIENGTYAESNGARRLFVCGQDADGGPKMSVRGGQAVLDIDEPFTATARFRKVVKLGHKATFGCPTVWYRNPQGTTAGTLTLTATYTRDFVEQRSQSVELPPTDFGNRIALGRYTFEGIQCADAAVVDLTFSLSYSGTAWVSEVTPSIDAAVVPYKVGEALAQ
jgi:hypothetical protein